MSTSKNKREAKIVEVTPKMAQEWLDTTNHVNRDLSQSAVDAIARTMSQGEWKLTFEPIAFCDEYVDKDTGEKFGETMMEGQHRMMAVVQSGKTIPFTVWRHCDQEEFEVVGTARPRSQGDLLQINRRGLKNPKLTATVINGFLRYGLGLAGDKVNSWMVRRVLEHIEKEIVAVVDYKLKLKNLAPRQLTAALVMAQIIDPEKTEFMVAQIRSGLGMKHGDPSAAVRQYMYDRIMKPEREVDDVFFYKVCCGVAAGLTGDRIGIGKLRPEASGLKHLRGAGKDTLNPLAKDIFGKVPDIFHNPKLSFKAQEALGTAAR